MPNLLKIGYTTRKIEERVQELSATGVPGKFTVELYFETDNAQIFEMLLHKSLQAFRFEKEFFKTDIKTAIQVIHILIGKDEIHLFQFYGLSSLLATTKEQVQHQRKIDFEKKKRVEQKANELKEKYLNKSYAELVSMRYALEAGSYDPINKKHYAIMEVNKIMNLRRMQISEYSNKTFKELEILLISYEDERFSYEKEKIQKFLLSFNTREGYKIYQSKYEEKYRDLKHLIDSLLDIISPNRNTLIKKLAFKYLGYNFNDGKKIGTLLNQNQKKIVIEFDNLTKEITHLTTLNPLSLISIAYINPLMSINGFSFSEYFRGILSSSYETSIVNRRELASIQSQEYIYQWELTPWGMLNIMSGHTIPISFIEISKEKNGVLINYKRQNEFIEAKKIKNFLKI